MSNKSLEPVQGWLTWDVQRAVMNQWTVPLEWNGGMEYWNDL